MSFVHWVSQSAVARPLRRLSVAVPGMAGASMTALAVVKATLRSGMAPDPVPERTGGGGPKR